MYARFLLMIAIGLALAGLGSTTLAEQPIPGGSQGVGSSAQSSQPLGPPVQRPPTVAVEPNGKQSEDDMTVLARGPIHEAYAQPYESNPASGPKAPRRPPDPITEIPPDQKPTGDNVQWVPGYWSWDTDRNDYLWVSGFWRVAPPARRWVPGHWAEADGSWQWASGFWAPAAQGELGYVPQPPASIDNGPSIPGSEDTSYYVPGSWVYRAPRFAWRPGYWLGYRPGWIWCPARYYWTPAGYVFNDGYWDYCLENRGILFAPVWFHRPLWLTAGWSYRPYWTFGIGFYDSFHAFFVRPSWGLYYWGDYFDRSYARNGFHPWYSWGPHFHDPLYSYYRWYHRADPNWNTHVRDQFLAYRAGEVPRLAHTYAEQRAFLSAADRSHVRILTPLSGEIRQGSRLTALSAGQLAHERAATQAIRDLSVQRGRAERTRAGASLSSMQLPPHMAVQHAQALPSVNRAPAGQAHFSPSAASPHSAAPRALSAPTAGVHATRNSPSSAGPHSAPASRTIVTPKAAPTHAPSLSSRAMHVAPATHQHAIAPQHSTTSRSHATASHGGGGKGHKK